MAQIAAHTYDDQKADQASYDAQCERESRAPRDDIPATYVGERQAPVHLAQVPCATAISRFFEAISLQRLIRTVIVITPGVGKTYMTLAQAVDYCRADPRVRIELSEPTLEKCEEVVGDLRRIAGDVQIHLVKGRCLENCTEFERVKEAGEIGITAIGRTVCAGCPLNPRNGGDCDYYAKMNAAAAPGITVYAHAYLALPRPRSWPAPAGLIIDESPEAMHKADYDISTLRARLPAERAIVAALASGMDRLRTDLVALAGLDKCATKEAMIKAAKNRLIELRSIRSKAIKKSLDALAALSRSDDELSARRRLVHAEKVRRCLAWLAIISTLLYDLVKGWQMERVYQVDTDGKAMARVITLKSATRQSWQAPTLPHEPPAEPRPLPVMLLDGTANRALVSEIMTVPGRVGGEVEWIRMDAAINATVVQINDSMGSAYSLIVADGGDAKLADIIKMARSKAARGKRVVIFAATKAVADAIRALLGDGDNLIDVHHAHCVQGLNRWENYDVAILAGLPRPPFQDAEDVALALHGTVRRYFGTIEDMPHRWDGYRFARNGRQQGVLVPHHPDPVVDEIWMHMINSAAVQALHRIRPVRTHDVDGNPLPEKEIIVYSKMPIDLTVTATVRRRDMVARAEDMSSGCLDGAWRRSPGFLPLSPMALFATEAYATKGAAKLCPDVSKIRAALADIGAAAAAQETQTTLVDGAGAGIVTSKLPCILNSDGAISVTPTDPANALYVVKARQEGTKGGRDVISLLEAPPGSDMTTIPTRQHDAAGNVWIIRSILAVLSRLVPADVIELKQRQVREIVEQQAAAIKAEHLARLLEENEAIRATNADMAARRPAIEEANRIAAEQRAVAEAAERAHREAVKERQRTKAEGIVAGKLRQGIFAKLGSLVKADLWLRTSHPRFAGMSPVKYAVVDLNLMTGRGDNLRVVEEAIASIRGG